MKSVDLKKVNQFLLCKQHLTKATKSDDIYQIVDDIGGLHATGASTPYISLFARAHSFKKDSLREVMEVRRRLGKIRSVRKTVYILTNKMIPIFFNATKKGLEKITKPHLDYLGVTEKEYKKTSKMILKELKGKCMDVREIKRSLKSKENISAIVNYMCDKGLLIRGLSRKSWKSNSHTYYLFHEYFPDIKLDAMGESKAIELLVFHYLKSFGPATENDIVWWAGLNKKQIRQALEALEGQTELIGISSFDGDFIMLNKDDQPLKAARTSKKGVVNLLPWLDPYMMGYKERRRYLDYEYYDFIFDRSGNTTMTILIDGRIKGVWDVESAKEPIMKLYLFIKQKREMMKLIHRKAREMGEFITDKKVQIKECDAMTPLPKRTAGSFMSPLKDC
jgi:hypothetical protein